MLLPPQNCPLCSKHSDLWNVYWMLTHSCLQCFSDFPLHFEQNLNSYSPYVVKPPCVPLCYDHMRLLSIPQTPKFPCLGLFVSTWNSPPSPNPLLIDQSLHFSRSLSSSVLLPEKGPSSSSLHVSPSQHLARSWMPPVQFVRMYLFVYWLFTLPVFLARLWTSWG